MGYNEYIYKGAAKEAIGLLGPFYTDLFTLTTTGGNIETYTFYESNTTTSAITRVVEVGYKAADKEEIDYAKRVS